MRKITDKLNFKVNLDIRLNLTQVIIIALLVMSKLPYEFLTICIRMISKIF